MSTIVLPSGTLYSLDDFDDDYEFGIDKTNMAVRFIETPTGTVTLQNGEIANPFFVGVFGGSLKELEMSEIYRNYKRIYILCMKNNFKMSDKLFQITQQIVKDNEFYQIGSEFSLISVSLAVLTNNTYKSRACIVDKSHLTKMFGKTYDFDLTEIIVPLIEQTEDTVNILVSLYDQRYSLKNINEMLAITSHYNKNYKKPIIRQFCSHINSLKETQFWSEPRNCDINMTEEFLERGFNYKDLSEDEQLITTNVVNITNTNTKSDKKPTDVERAIKILSKGSKKDSDYINSLHASTTFTDISSALRNSSKRTYYISLDDAKLDINKNDVTRMICQIDNVEELYHTFNSFAISKEYCHMVVNNKDILERMIPLFEKFAPIYKYILGYSWLCFSIEESIMKTKSSKKNRYVFDINTANKLPVFPFVMEDLTQNPYVSLLINKNAIAPMTNAMSLHCIENFKDHYGVCNIEEFNWRFNLFTTWNPNKNIFEGLNWEHYAVSGSIIPACLQKKSPLFESPFFKHVLSSQPNMTKEDEWLTFFNCYYGESDIDIMCNDMSMFGFCSKVSTVIETIKKNIVDYKSGDIDVEPNKSFLMLISDHFFTEKLKDYNEHFNDDYTSETMKAQLNTEEMREFLFAFYFDYKSKINRVIRKEKKDDNVFIKSFMEKGQQNDMKLKHITKTITKQQDRLLQDSDMSFYVNDFRSVDNKVPESENYLVMKICENIKFKIKSKKIKTIEIFRSKSEDFFNTVARFHFPCVRAYYQGNNVYMLPSCVTAMMTGINCDYKYFAGVRNPIEIANKYRMRGFSLMFNSLELKDMAYYNTHVNTHGGMFHIPNSDKAEIAKAFGPKELTDKIYRPSILDKELLNNIDQNLDHTTYLKTVTDLKRYYKTRHGYDENTFGFNLFTIKSINDTGSVSPYKNWVSIEYFNNAQSDSFQKLPLFNKFLHPEKIEKIEKINNNSNVESKVEEKVKAIEEKIKLQEKTEPIDTKPKKSAKSVKMVKQK